MVLRSEVIIIGGGPAGAACAWRLMQAQVDCLILDQQPFPRFKPCAGWITPEVVSRLGILGSGYPGSFTKFTSFDISIRGFKFRLRTRQYAIRRFEFDEWLLRRSGAPVRQHTARVITLEKDGYKIDGEYFGKYLVGAGGTHCPVRRTFFDPGSAREKGSLIIAQEDEFPYAAADPRCRLWFLENGLPGYAWYVPKSNGYVNVGVGGSAEQLKANGDTLKRHWRLLEEKLGSLGLVRGYTFKPVGHSYYLRQKHPHLRRDDVLIAGDAAGLATLDMGEGIGPAVHSGFLAAEAILHDSDYSIDAIPRYSFWSMIRSGFVKAPP